MYPFSSSSWSHFFSASSSFGGSGYNLQSRVSGASGFSVIAWSHGQDGGSFFYSTGSKILACLRYSSGIAISWVNLPASLDNSIEIPLSEDSLLSSWNIISCCRCVFICSLCPMMILAITGLIHDFLQTTNRMMMGRKEVSIAASLHLNLGSKVESQGYPKMRSSPPKSVTRNFITSCLSPVQTSRSTQCVSAPALLVVPSIFHIFRGLSRGWLPRPSCWSSFGWIKLSVAPESTRIVLSAVACNVTIQRIVAWLDLSRPWVEFAA